MKTRGTAGLSTPKQNDDYIYNHNDKRESPKQSPEQQQQEETATKSTANTNNNNNNTVATTLHPLIKCPLCPKSFKQSRSLYGHFGGTHAKGGNKLNHEKILYGCPYCKEEVTFGSLEDVERHVERFHGCGLLEVGFGSGQEQQGSGGGQVNSTSAATSMNESALEEDMKMDQEIVQEKKKDVQMSEPSLSVHTTASHPLGKCPSCPRILSLRGVFGHFGRVHGGSKFDWDKVKYLCPFCDNPEGGDEKEAVMYDTFDELERHVDSEHEGCELLQITPSLRRSTSAATSTNESTSKEEMEMDQENVTQKEVENSEPSSSVHTTSHPLGKCPSCPRILSLRGVFGHFGRVHGASKFDWDKVKYLCPFCDNQDEGGDEKEAVMYDTFDELEAHVDSEHEGCELLQMGPSQKRSRSEGNTNEETAAASSPEKETAIVARSSRRRTSITSLTNEETTTTTTIPTEQSPQKSTPIQYQCPSCERTFNKQGLATHYGMVHSKTLQWEKVKYAEYEGRVYICPECERTFTKTGLSTHYGMMHDGTLNWDRVMIVDGGEGFTLKRKREVMEKSCEEGMDEGQEEEEEEGPVRKSRRISARAASRNFEEEVERDVVGFPSGAAAAASASAATSAVASSAAASGEVPSLNFGPWTTEEHEAFLLGHKNHGNEWKRISTEYVPTRTPKQIGSHALAYFTTQGQWGGRKGVHKSAKEDEKQDNQQPAKQPDVKSSGTTKHVLFGDSKDGSKVSSKVKASGDAKPAKEKKKSTSNAAAMGTMEKIQIRRSGWSAQEHAAFIEGHKKFGNSWQLISQLFVPSRTPKQVGSHALHHFTSIGKWEEAKKPKRDPSLYEEELPMDESQSQEHSDDGNFDYCIVCEDGGELVCCSVCPRSFHRACMTLETATLPPNWICERCQTDVEVNPEEELPDIVSSKDIQSVYSNLVYSEGFESCSVLLTKLSLIVAKLKDSDHGYIFADPVDLNIVPNYTKIVSVPMDYSTISKKIHSGEYTLDLKPLMKRPMESILLLVMHDIELVHQNCAKFNPKRSSVYRAGQTQAKKWSAFYNKYLSSSLPDTVTKAYQNGKLDTENEPPKEQEPEKKEQEPPEQTTPKKTKRVDTITPSSGVIFTKEQFDALEKIYTLPATDLTEQIVFTSEENARIQVSQWFEKLDDLRKYKVTHGSAVVTIAQDDKLYQWITRQRKRYHLTLHHKPEFQREKISQSNPSSDPNEKESDITWLMKSPSMTGTFALSPEKKVKKKKSSTPPAPKKADTKAMMADIKSSEAILRMHHQTLYYPMNSSPPYRHSSSLFWDECLEELRFFRGEHKHIIVPRSFPHNEHLSLWSEVQRAKLLLHFVGFDSGLLGSQILVLDDELHLIEYSNSPLATASVASTHNNRANEDDDDVDDVHDSSDKSSAVPPPKISNDTLSIAPTEPLEAKSNQPILTESNVNDGTSKQSRAPLCKCTACEKAFQSLRKLYGHFGSAHSRIMGMKINTDDVLFGCPFCEDGVFKRLPEIEVHVKDFHPNCNLLKVEYSQNAGNVNKPKSKEHNSQTAPVAPKKKSMFRKQLSEFAAWYEQNPFPDRDKMSKELYLWCWRQCNGASALLLGTPNISNVKMNMNAAKLKLLATEGFFRVFSHHDKGMVCEDDYEGAEEWTVVFNEVQAFSISTGSTIIPDYHFAASTSAWIADMHNELQRFIKGEHCDLSTHQIEELILIGFCSDRSDLPNLTRSDVIWLKRFRELKQYQLMVGDCNVTEDFPQLYQWINEQKKLFRLFRMGRVEMMKIERIRLLTDAGVDFFTADYFPQMTKVDLMKFTQQISTPPDLFQGGMSAATSASLDGDLNDEDFSARFDSMKATNGHCLVLADDNLDVYQWFIAMRSALLDSFVAKSETYSGYNLFHHLNLSCVDDKSKIIPDKKSFKNKESLITWTKLCERFMMFLAVKGHGHIPNNYPDIPLVQWLAKQQDEIYSHCARRSISELPLHLKLLVSLGVKGKKRDVQPTFSSRVLRRKGPVKSKTKK